MKVSHDQLLEIVRKLVKEALKEAGPMGYLSKTKRPDAATGWNPAAQKQWVAGVSDPTSPGKPVPTQPSGPAGTTSINSPPTNLAPDEGDKTNAGIPSAKTGMKPSPTATTATAPPAGPENSLADMSSMLQTASQDQIAQIMRILKGS